MFFGQYLIFLLDFPQPDLRFAFGIDLLCPKLAVLIDDKFQIFCFSVQEIHFVAYTVLKMS